MDEKKQIKRKRSEVVDTEIFVARMRTLMELKGLSSSELADQSDLARSTLTQFLAGNTKPSADALVKLADMLDASIDYLLGRSDESELADLLRHEKIVELVRMFAQLSVPDQQRVSEMIRLMAKTALPILPSK
jgi:transcriptional regulator with XRE-family HTH domain